MTYFSFTRRSSTLPLQTYVTRCFGNTLAHAGQASPHRRTLDGTSLPLPLLQYAHSPRGHSQLGLVPGATPGSVGPAEHTGGRPRKDDLANGPTVRITRCLLSDPTPEVWGRPRGTSARLIRGLPYKPGHAYETNPRHRGDNRDSERRVREAEEDTREAEEDKE